MDSYSLRALHSLGWRHKVHLGKGVLLGSYNRDLSCSLRSQHTPLQHKKASKALSSRHQRGMSSPDNAPLNSRVLKHPDSLYRLGTQGATHHKSHPDTWGVLDPYNPHRPCNHVDPHTHLTCKCVVDSDSPSHSDKPYDPPQRHPAGQHLKKASHRLSHDSPESKPSPIADNTTRAISSK